MSRKRKLKKLDKRRAQWILSLEDLYLRRADDAFLEAARPHAQELAAASMAEPYAEVAGRALAAALTGGDPARVKELLARIRRDAAPGPLVLLAEAVGLLAQGRREPAAARLAALAEAGPDSEAALGAARRLPPRLRVLAGLEDAPAAARGADTSAPWQENGELGRLWRVLEAHAAAGAGLPRSLEPAEPGQRAAWHFYRALAAVGGRSFRPGEKTLSALALAVDAVRRQGPVDRPLAHLLRETQKRLRVLAKLRELEQSLRRRAGDLLPADLDGAGLSARLLDDDPPALLGPLQQALRTRWRELLVRILERRGAAGLAALYADRPELLAADLDAGDGAAATRRWAQAKTLRESGSFDQLGDLLRSAAVPAGPAARRAALWSLELWARQEAVEATDLASAHPVLERLAAMANAVAACFIAVERPQVARFLRDELVELWGVLLICDHFLDAAKALLEHLGDDPVLLTIALAGAVDSEDRRTRGEVTARIAALGPARADQEILLRLAGNLAAERPAVAVPVLSALEPLFTGAGWSAALDRVAPEAVDGMREGLVEAAVAAIDDPEDAAWVLGEFRRDLELYRPLLDGRPELAALDLAVDGWGAAPAAVKPRVADYLGRFDGLEPALVLYRQTLELSDAGVCPPADAALVGAVIDRLDARWRLWMSLLVPLTFEATPRQIAKLRRRLRDITKDPRLDVDARQALLTIQKQIGRIRKARRLLPGDLELPELEPLDESEARPVKHRARRPRPVDERQLPLFMPE